MITSSRPASATKPAAALLPTVLGTLTVAVCLISVAVTSADDLGDGPFFVLLGAQILLVAVMGAIAGAMRMQAVADVAGIEEARMRRDQETLDALEPLRSADHAEPRADERR
ncbi:hypothetical protein AB8O64_05895 [Streptomyces sp. QH1-20]|uniref:hypothetical protein n=1 Tax=Streptomyces sp. QH1-20 TaxID=3240934 RepID=UPI003513A0C6